MSETGNSFKQTLFQNGGEGFEQLTMWLCLFFGAWLSSGVLLQNLNIFTLCLAILAAIRFLAPMFLEAENALWKGIGVSFVLLSFLFVSAERIDSPLVPTLAMSILLFAAYFVLPKKFPHFLIARSFSIVVLCSLLWLLGMYTQQEVTYENVYPAYFLIGVIPGTVLASRQLILSDDVFLEKGWKRKRLVEGKGDRPGSYTQLILSFLILGPVLPALLLPFSILPHGFLLASLAFYFIPKIGEEIEEPKDQREVTALRVTHIALGLNAAMFLALQF